MFYFPNPYGELTVGILRSQFNCEGETIPLTFFYPADESDGKNAKYSFAEALFGHPLSEAKTNFFSEAPISQHKEKYPVIFYSHGYGSYEMSNSVLCGDLASMGFVVIAIGHTGEATAVRLKDGTIIPMDETHSDEMNVPEKEEILQKIMMEVAAKDFTEENYGTFIEAGRQFCDSHAKNKRMEIWAKRIRTAADYMEEVNKSNYLLAGHLDLIPGFGITGHSFGGGAAISVCREDSRFVCGIDVDGANLEEDYGQDIRKPFLCIGTEITSKLLSGIYLSNTENTYQLVLKDVEHMGFTDLVFFPDIAEMMGIPLGSMEGNKLAAILAQYHANFFRKYLLKEDLYLEMPDESVAILKFREKNC
ncbi:hypothetical protein FJQ98_15100 [Lysinibacillus agricola]|uniref:Platelet-activating factor acetylhydrolase n=1 Tax=Lysinibacillus agricola TaxID=2590012 RepID=A0ABX7AL50_9BACI|nr:MULTISPECIES: hypothetical protein [Lysinibacillus]KOS59816.1 hypothetical protein AN161_26200 [Lysinibacillus sp. FJAT-14222]QQP10591.1 hypothetical protein FJQ98_15100 [Lysinibacillus agricola]